MFNYLPAFHSCHNNFPQWALLHLFSILCSIRLQVEYSPQFLLATFFCMDHGCHKDNVVGSRLTGILTLPTVTEPIRYIPQMQFWLSSCTSLYFREAETYKAIYIPGSMLTTFQLSYPPKKVLVALLNIWKKEVLFLFCFSDQSGTLHDLAS